VGWLVMRTMRDQEKVAIEDRSEQKSYSFFEFRIFFSRFSKENARVFVT